MKFIYFILLLIFTILHLNSTANASLEQLRKDLDLKSMKDLSQQFIDALSDIELKDQNAPLILQILYEGIDKQKIDFKNKSLKTAIVSFAQWMKDEVYSKIISSLSPTNSKNAVQIIKENVDSEQPLDMNKLQNGECPSKEKFIVLFSMLILHDQCSNSKLLGKEVFKMVDNDVNLVSTALFRVFIAMRGNLSKDSNLKSIVFRMAQLPMKTAKLELTLLSHVYIVKLLSEFLGLHSSTTFISEPKDSVYLKLAGIYYKLCNYQKLRRRYLQDSVFDTVREIMDDAENSFQLLSYQLLRKEKIGKLDDMMPPGCVSSFRDIDIPKISREVAEELISQLFAKAMPLLRRGESNKDEISCIARKMSYAAVRSDEDISLAMYAKLIVLTKLATMNKKNDLFISIFRSKLKSKNRDDPALNAPKMDGSLAQMFVYYIFDNNTSFPTSCHDQLESAYDYVHDERRHDVWVREAYIPIFFAKKFSSTLITGIVGPIENVTVARLEKALKLCIIMGSIFVQDKSIVLCVYLKIAMANIAEAMQVESLYQEFYALSPIYISYSVITRLNELGLFPAIPIFHINDSKVTEQNYVQLRNLLMTYNIMKATQNTGTLTVDIVLRHILSILYNKSLVEINWADRVIDHELIKFFDGNIKEIHAFFLNNKEFRDELFTIDYIKMNGNFLRRVYIFLLNCVKVLQIAHPLGQATTISPIAITEQELSKLLLIQISFGSTYKSESQTADLELWLYSSYGNAIGQAIATQFSDQEEISEWRYKVWVLFIKELLKDNMQELGKLLQCVFPIMLRFHEKTGNLMDRLTYQCFTPITEKSGGDIDFLMQLTGVTMDNAQK